MANIFVSYRRVDSQDMTAWIVDYLKSMFGDSNIFRDIYDIAPGKDFTELLRESLDQCDIVIVVLGQKWVQEINRRNEQHLHGDIDWVHEEVNLALTKHKHIIIALIDGASIPQKAVLPEDLASLSNCNLEVSISTKNFDANLDELFDVLVNHPGAQEIVSEHLANLFHFTMDDLNLNRQHRFSPTQRHRFFQRFLIQAVGFVIALMFAVAVFFLLETLDVSPYLIGTCLICPSIIVLFILSLTIYSFLFPSLVKTASGYIVEVNRDGAEVSKIRIGDIEIALGGALIASADWSKFTRFKFLIYYTSLWFLDNQFLSLELNIDS